MTGGPVAERTARWCNLQALDREGALLFVWGADSGSGVVVGRSPHLLTNAYRRHDFLLPLHENF